MDIKRKYSVFISSTYEDLKEIRQAVFDVALDNDFIPVGMEQFHAAPVGQWEIIKKMIDGCDLYLLIIGGRYGSIDSKTGLSYTEKEYKYALEKKIPILVLVQKQEAITFDKIDTDDDKIIKQQKLEKFRKHVLNDDKTVDFFKKVDDVKEYLPNNAGWVRYSDINNILESKEVKQAVEFATREEVNSIFSIDDETLKINII